MKLKETHKYDDIIHLGRPESRRARMSAEDRAAQFSPFFDDRRKQGCAPAASSVIRADGNAVDNILILAQSQSGSAGQPFVLQKNPA